jgi:hypothetical protein
VPVPRDLDAFVGALDLVDKVRQAVARLGER